MTGRPTTSEGSSNPTHNGVAGRSPWATAAGDRSRTGNRSDPTSGDFSYELDPKPGDFGDGADPLSADLDNLSTRQLQSLAGATDERLARGRRRRYAQIAAVAGSACILLGLFVPLLLPHKQPKETTIADTIADTTASHQTGKPSRPGTGTLPITVPAPAGKDDSPTTSRPSSETPPANPPPSPPTTTPSPSSRDQPQFARVLHLSIDERYSYGIRLHSRKQGTESTRLISKDSGFSFLSSVKGHFGGSERASVHVEPDGDWHLFARSKHALMAEAVSLQALGSRVFQEDVQVHSWKKGEAPVKLLHKSEGICFLSQICGSFRGYGQRVHVYLGDDDHWYLGGHSPKEHVQAEATCLRFAAPESMQAEIVRFEWRKREAPVRMLSLKEGFCFLAAISGKFAGPGEQVRLYLGENGYWYLGGSTMQPQLSVQAVCLRFGPKAASDTPDPDPDPAAAEAADETTGDGPASAASDSSTGPEATDLYGDSLPPGAVARLGSLRWRYGSDIGVLQFSPDGRFLVCRGKYGDHAFGPFDTTLRVFDAKTGNLIRKLDEAPYVPYGFAFTPDGKGLICTTNANVDRLWNIETGEVLWEYDWKPHPPDQLVPNGDDGKTWFHVRGGTVLFSPDGKRVLLARFRRARTGASAGADVLWSRGSGYQVYVSSVVLDVETGRPVGDGSFERDPFPLKGPNLLAVKGQSLFFMQPLNGEVQKEFRLASTEIRLKALRTVWFTPDERVVALKSDNRTISADFETGRVLANFTNRGKQQEAWGDFLTFSPDGKLALLKWKKLRQRESKWNLRMVNVRTGQIVAEFVVTRDDTPQGRVHAAFAPGGQRVAVALEDRIRIWKFREQKSPPSSIEGHPDIVRTIVLSPDAALAATANPGPKPSVRLWSTRTGRQLRHWCVDSQVFARQGLAFSANSRVLAFPRGQRTLDLLDCTDGSLVHRLSAVVPEGQAFYKWDTPYPAFFPDGKRLAWWMPNAKAIMLWDVTTGKLLHVHPPEISESDDPGTTRDTIFMFYGDTFSPSRKLLACSRFSSRVVYVVETETGKQVFKRQPPRAVTTLCFSPDEKRLAIGMQNNTCQVVDLTSGEIVQTLRAPDFGPRFGRTYDRQQGAFPRAFLGGGRVLATHHSQNATCFRDLETGQEIDRIDGHRLEVFSAGGGYAASLSDTHTPLVWDLAKWRKLSLEEKVPEHPKREDSTR